MYEPIGHGQLRTTLSSHQGSFALVGPAGVGKRGVVSEWIDQRPAEQLLPTALDRAARRPGLLHVLDASRVTDWAPFLRPLEEDAFPVVVIADTNLPPAVASRLPVFRAGYLSEAEVGRILAEHFPTLRPRPLLARLAEGSLDGIEALARSAKTFETLDRCLTEGVLPDRRIDPFALLDDLRAVCRAVLGLSPLPLTAAARAAVRAADAVEFLRTAIPRSWQEARNLLVLFLARLRRG